MNRLGAAEEPDASRALPPTHVRRRTPCLALPGREAASGTALEMQIARWVNTNTKVGGMLKMLRNAVNNKAVPTIRCLDARAKVPPTMAAHVKTMTNVMTRDAKGASMLMRLSMPPGSVP